MEKVASAQRPFCSILVFFFPKIIEAQLGNFPIFPDLSKDFFDN